MKKKLIFAILLATIMFSCDMSGDIQLADKYIGNWIAQSYDVAGTDNDYSLAELTTDQNENKTHRFIISQGSFTQYNKAGTLKVKCSIDPDTDSSFAFTVTDPGLDTMNAGSSAYYDILDDSTTGGIILNAYWDSSKSSGIIATYHLLKE